MGKRIVWGWCSKCERQVQTQHIKANEYRCTRCSSETFPVYTPFEVTGIQYVSGVKKEGEEISLSDLTK